MLLNMIIFIKYKIINNVSKRLLLEATYKMGEIKEINIKNWTYYFYNDIIDLKNFDARSLKVDKKSYKNIGIYSIGYITI